SSATAPEHDCRGVFIDSVGRRRWCPSPACASRGRVKALRARRAADRDCWPSTEKADTGHAAGTVRWRQRFLREGIGRTRNRYLTRHGSRRPVTARRQPVVRTRVP
ncbi:CGNR zinc finger domain-containing protein, partial [Streptomyces rochei]|uniref:CGNR zinc finger domain-containing protein n=1 Tax=Streptomyces rochei TaxID=1928 RepID=UPI00379A0622